MIFNRLSKTWTFSRYEFEADLKGCHQIWFGMMQILSSHLLTVLSVTAFTHTRNRPFWNWLLKSENKCAACVCKTQSGSRESALLNWSISVRLKLQSAPNWFAFRLFDSHFIVGVNEVCFGNPKWCDTYSIINPRRSNALLLFSADTGLCSSNTIASIDLSWILNYTALL